MKRPEHWKEAAFFKDVTLLSSVLITNVKDDVDVYLEQTKVETRKHLHTTVLTPFVIELLIKHGQFSTKLDEQGKLQKPEPCLMLHGLLDHMRESVADPEGQLVAHPKLTTLPHKNGGEA